jgi:flagellar biosynthesis/type III secretory pathway protein FliH
MSIQRWTMRGATRHGGGDFVTYADHVEALRKARAEEREAAYNDSQTIAFIAGQDKEREMSAPAVANAYDKGQREGWDRGFAAGMTEGKSRALAEREMDLHVLEALGES